MPRSLARELVAPGFRIDRSGLYARTAALNTVAVTAVLGWGVASGHVGTGLLLALGALMAALPGLGAPPRKRVTTMASVAVLTAFSTFVGVSTGGIGWLAVLVMAAWGFAGGMCACLGRVEGLVGATMVLALLLVAQYPADAGDAALRALATFGGAALQVAITAIVWQLVRDRPQRAALAGVYADLAALARSPHRDGELLAVFAALRDAQATISDAEGGPAARSPRGVARRGLLDDGDTIARELEALRREGDPRVVPVLAAIAAALTDISTALAAGHGAGDLGPAHRVIADAEAHLRALPGGDDLTLALTRITELRAHARTAWELTAAATGPHVPGRAIDPAATRARLHDIRGTLADNLTLRSAVFRHAVRLAGATAFGVAAYHVLDLDHGYWIPLTVLFVLRPDFGMTFSRGALRAGGTLLGIGLGGLLVLAVGGHDGWLVVGAAATSWATMAFLFANYAIFTTSITALVVLLVDLSGAESATTAITQRLLYSAAGIAIALAAFLVWPTWSRDRMAASIGAYLAALRAFTGAMLAACADPGRWDPGHLHELRAAQRLARVNASDALATAQNEPDRGRRTAAAAHILGAGYQMHEATLVLGVLLAEAAGRVERPAVAAFARDLDTALLDVEQRWAGSLLTAVADAPSPPDAEPAVERETATMAAAVRALAAAVG